MFKRFIAITSLLIGSLPLFANMAEVNLQDLMRDTQRMDTKGDGMTLAWWLPTEFWQFSLESDGDISPDEQEEMLELVDNYTVLIVLDAVFTPTDGVEAATREEVIERTTLSINGNEVPMLSFSELDEEMGAVIMVMKPMFVQMLGEFGNGLHFLVYPNSGEYRINAKHPGRMRCQIGDKIFTWRMPLGSILPPKLDPKTGEKFPGNYNYNPYTGDPLEAESPKIKYDIDDLM